MSLSWRVLLKEWLKFEKKTKRWSEEAAQGWNTVQAGTASLTDRSFKEVESIRLHYRLERVNRKLMQAYRSLGKKVSDHWAADGHPLTEEEKKREFRRIHLLLDEQKKVMDQIEEMEVSFSSDEKPLS